MLKPKLSVEEQIAHMERRGITFHHISKEEAAYFLQYHTYYFKLKAYAKNYTKYQSGENARCYCNLDFAYLKDLSTIDSHLRKFIIKITLDIEHFLKVKLLRDFASIDAEDGYGIVEEFFSRRPAFRDEVIQKERNSNCFELIEKHKDHFALWNVVEVLPFGAFIQLYKLFYEKYPAKNDMTNMLLPVKFLRNAAAHNNCLINNMGAPYARTIKPNLAVTRYISQIPGISAKTRGKKMANPVVHDFVVMLYVFCHVVTSEETKTRTLFELKQLIDTRIPRHRKYYQDNELLTSHYRFLKKVVDFFCDSHIMIA